MFNKKAQIGETMTWVVATVIIIVILGVAIFAASLFFKETKKPNFASAFQTDALGSESFFSYLLTKDASGDIVYRHLQQEGNLSEFNGNLAQAIFDVNFNSEYKNIWVGIELNRADSRYLENVYFGKRPVTVRGGTSPDVLVDIAHPGTEIVSLDETKWIELVLNNV